MMLWLGIALGGLVALAMGLRAVGASRWARMIRAHTTLLESDSVDARGRLPAPTRFDPRELEGLPAPVQRYFRAVLTDGQPIIAAATRYSYPQLAFKLPTLAPGQNSIGTGGQY
ncbi:MAG: DUF6544 family protein [Rhodoferax sp.]